MNTESPNVTLEQEVSYKDKGLDNAEVSDTDKISAVIPTYNRCPNNLEFKYNPIWWAANSLFNQKNIGEIVFVDDGSRDSDYFSETIEQIRDASPDSINIRAIKNGSRLGSGASRNVGVRVAEYDKIFFMDDDCITVGPEVLPDLSFAFNYLTNEGISVGAMNLPVNADTLDTVIKPMSIIGKVNQEKGLMEGCYTYFPEEYIDEPIYINEERGILRPLKVDLVHGVFMSDKKVFLDAGGFPTTRWRNACAEEPELIFEMQKNGHGIFYLPSDSLTFRVFHARYGEPHPAKIPFPFSVDGVSFEEIYQASSRGAPEGHGNRVNKEEQLYSSIISGARLMFKYFGTEMGLNNLQTRYSGVEGNPQDTEIFRKAVSDGLDLLIEENIISREEENRVRSTYLSKDISL